MPAHDVFGLAIREEGTLSNSVILFRRAKEMLTICLVTLIMPPAVPGSARYWKENALIWLLEKARGWAHDKLYPVWFYVGAYIILVVSLS